MDNSILPKSFGQRHLLKAVKSNIEDLKSGKTEEVIPTLDAISEELDHLHKHAIETGLLSLFLCIFMGLFFMCCMYVYLSKIALL